MISVLVCTYNQEKYLAQALDSILMQNCAEPFEILIGDDCSTDSTGKIADEYQLRYPKIVRVIHPLKNGGSTKNFISLVNNAMGDYLMICDGDDYWLRDDMMQLYVDIYRQQHKVGMICAKAKCYIQEIGDYQGTLGYAGAENLVAMLRDNRDVAAPTIAFRRDLMLKCIAESQWYIDNNYFYDSIMAYWFAYNSSIRFIDEEVAAYRVLQNSACHANDLGKVAEYERRYFAVKWHFLMTHPVLCNQDTFDILMHDYDERTKNIAHVAETKIRTTKTYRLGSFVTKPFRKQKNK